VVYEVNALRAPNDVEIVPIGEAVAPAVQPIAIAKQSKHRHLTARLIEALRAEASKKRFEGQGFVWKAGQGARGAGGGI
jgi:hypothetical protein